VPAWIVAKALSENLGERFRHTENPADSSFDARRVPDFSSTFPTACAVGFILAPLCGELARRSFQSD
jgi:hypothetical protein